MSCELLQLFKIHIFLLQDPSEEGLNAFKHCKLGNTKKQAAYETATDRPKKRSRQEDGKEEEDAISFEESGSGWESGKIHGTYMHATSQLQSEKIKMGEKIVYDFAYFLSSSL